MALVIFFAGSLWVFHSHASLRPWDRRVPSRASVGLTVLLSLLPLILLGLGWHETHPQAFRLAVMFSMSLIFVDLSLNPSSEEPETMFDKARELVTDEIMETITLGAIGVLMVPVFVLGPSMWLYVLVGLVMLVRISRIPYLMTSFDAAKQEGGGLPIARESYLASQLIVIGIMFPLAFMASGLVRVAGLGFDNFNAFGTQSLIMLGGSGLGVATRTALRALCR